MGFEEAWKTTIFYNKTWVFQTLVYKDLKFQKLSYKSNLNHLGRCKSEGQKFWMFHLMQINKLNKDICGRFQNFLFGIFSTEQQSHKFWKADVNSHGNGVLSQLTQFPSPKPIMRWRSAFMIRIVASYSRCAEIEYSPRRSAGTKSQQLNEANAASVWYLREVLLEWNWIQPANQHAYGLHASGK